jgi:hypothetical protein
VLRFTHGATERSDQFSLAAVLYECVTGRKPFRGGTLYELMHAAVSGEVEPPASLQRSLPPEIDPIILRALRPEPAERFESVEAFADALRPFAAPSSEATRGREVVAIAPAGPMTLLVRDDVAIGLRGDVFLALWNVPALMGRVRWMFDLADRFVVDKPNGILVLVVLTSSATPPSYGVIREMVVRMRRLRDATRRQVNVATGGPLWAAVVVNVHRAMKIRMMRASGKYRIAASLDGGLEQLLEKSGSLTPSAGEIRKDVRVLYDVMGIPLPASAGGAS